MPLFRASISGQAPLIAQLGPREGLGAKISGVTFVSDTSEGQAGFPQIYRPITPGAVVPTDDAGDIRGTTGNFARGTKFVRGFSEGASVSKLALCYGFGRNLPTLPPSNGANVQELPYYLQVAYPKGQEFILPPGEAVVFYAYSPSLTNLRNSSGHTWTLIVEWSE